MFIFVVVFWRRRDFGGFLRESPIGFCFTVRPPVDQFSKFKILVVAEGVLHVGKLLVGGSLAAGWLQKWFFACGF